MIRCPCQDASQKVLAESYRVCSHASFSLEVAVEVGPHSREQLVSRELVSNNDSDSEICCQEVVGLVEGEAMAFQAPSVMTRARLYRLEPDGRYVFAVHLLMQHDGKLVVVRQDALKWGLFECVGYSK